jgi:RHS repeat-associated protein
MGGTYAYRPRKAWITMEGTFAKVVGFVVLVSLILVVSRAAMAQASGYAFERAIVINHSQVANGDQTNFPVLLSGTFSDLATVANGGSVQSAQGYDIVFTSDSAGQNLLDHEIDTYNATTGAVNFWVRIPVLSHTTDTTIYMWYGNSSIVVSKENKAGVWTNGYVGVYHLGNGSSVSGVDSAGLNDGAVFGISEISGAIGGAAHFDGSGSDYIALPNSGSLKPTNALSLEGWVKPVPGSSYDKIFSLDYRADGTWNSPWISYALSLTGSTTQPGFQIASNSTLYSLLAGTYLPTSSWSHLAGTFDGQNSHIYVNGVADPNTLTVGGSVDYGTSKNVIIGKDGTNSPGVEGWDGQLDELRISSVARSADWIATEFNNQNSPGTFAFSCPSHPAGGTNPPCSLHPPASSYNYGRAVIFNHAEVPNSDQQNLPVLISGTYSDFANVANGGKVQSAQGYDIVFTSDSAGQNLLDHEIDTYNAATGAVNFWVRIPVLSHTTDTTIYMWYGNSSIVVSQESKSGVWSNGYAGVYHLGNGSSITGLDSAGTNNGVVNGAPATAGFIGGGGSFNGSSSQYIALPNSSSLKPTTALTLEAWVNPASANGFSKIFDLDYRGDGSWNPPYFSYSLTLTNNPQPTFFVSSNGSVSGVTAGAQLPLSAWSHLVGTYDGQQARIFLNGVADPNSAALSGNIDYGTSKGVTIGKDGINSPLTEGWNGQLDELRISSVARSADWIATEFNNQNSPGTFFSISNETPAAIPPTITSISPTTVEPGTQMTIIGTGFGSSQANGSVVLNNKVANIVSWNEQQIILTVPQGTSSGNLYVKQGGLNSNAVLFNSGPPYVVNIRPASSASAVPVTSVVVLNFNEQIDISTVSYGTVPISVSGFSGVLSGSYSLDSTGKVLTFTPLTPLPGNSTILVQVLGNGVADLAGTRIANSFSGSFTTAATSDTVPPQVLTITPNDGANGIAPNSTVVLTFSKSLNANTLSSNNLALIVNGSRLGFSISLSPDNRVVTLNAFGLPNGNTVGVVATSGITDLSGNALVNFQSQFTTGVTDTTHPQVFSQRPGNGATGVPNDTSVVIYFNDAMSASSLQDAIQISQNGTAVNGTTQISENGQVALFTPTAPLLAGTTTQVSVNSTALDLDGNTLNAYQGSFTTAVDTTNVAPQVTATNPVSGSNPVPTNAVIDLKFNEPLDPTKLTDTSVQCYQNSLWIQTALVPQGDGSLLQVIPRFPLASNAFIQCWLNTTLTGTNGLQFSGGVQLQYTTGTGPDTTVPTVLSVSPPNGRSNVGDNAYVRVVFSKPINPITVNGNTIQLAANGTSFVPDSIAFSNNNQNVLVVPHAPLPDSTVITLTIDGVSDSAGNRVATQSTQFTTGVGPDVVPPFVVASNPFRGAVGVPTNTAITVQFSQPTDPTTLGNSNGFNVSDATTNQGLSGTYSVSSDGETATFLPNTALLPNWKYSINWGQGITDLAGNLCCTGATGFIFTTGAGPNASAPQVLETVPANGATAVPTNAQVMVQFNEPVDSAKLTGITLSAGGSPTTTTPVLTNGNQTLRLIPAAPLSPNMSYALTISGLQDLSGNLQPTPVTSTFVTAAGADLSLPTAINVTPGGGASGVSINSAIQLQFNKPINPLTVTSATFQVYPNLTTIPISGSIVISLDGLTATFTPASPLDASTTYVINPTSGISDLEGQSLQGLSFNQGVFSTAQTLAGLPPYIQSLPHGNGGNVGNTVFLDGSYFGTSQGSSTVMFNGVAAPILFWSDTQIEAQVPSGATSGPIVVTVNGVTSNSIIFTVLNTATITGVSPASGAAGTSITITGANLGDSYDSITVTFSNQAGSFVTVNAGSANESSVTVLVPPSAPVDTQVVAIEVNGYSGASTPFTVIPYPTVTSLSPSSGVAGGNVTISGSEFGSSQGSSAVYFNGVPAASIVGWGNGTITAVPPNNVTSGPVTVVEGGITSNTNVVFTVTGPALGSMSPPAGAPGSVVNIAGSNLLVSGATTQIFFNGLAGQIVPNGNGIPIISPSGFSAYVPNSAISGPVTVVIGDSTSNALNFTVEQPPTVTDISPNNGQAGVWPIIITGSGFGATMSNSTVKFYDTVPAQIISWSDTEIQALAPQGIATGPISVQVGGLTAFGPSFYVTSPTLLTDSLGNQTTYNFGINGGAWGLASSTGPGCSTCTVRGTVLESTDTKGNVTSHTDDLGHVTSYSYNSNNDVSSISQQLNPSTPVTTSYTYNSFGEVLTATDSLGNVTTNTYDTNGNLQTVTSPAPNGSTPASVTHFGYDTKGELTSITDPLSNPTTLTYTTTGLIASITDAQNHTTSYQYDPRGNRTAVIDPINGAAHPTTFAYSIMNRLTGITYPDGSSVNFEYDYRGRRTSVTDQNQKTTIYTYDDADRLTAVTDPANNTTYYGYDTEDNLSSITDANNHTTNFAYNARGWVTQTTFPSTLYETYGYDAVGNLTSKTDRKNQTIQYVYDALNRLAQKSYPDSTSVDYLYDLASKLSQVNDPTGVYGFAYDNMGRLIGTTTQYSFLPNQTFANSYTYDAASNRKSLTAPDSSITTYGYDTLNRLNGLANSWAGSFSFGYDGLSRRTSLTRPNGVNTSYSYDSVSHLLSVLHQAGSNVLDGASYTYDAAGNRSSKTNYLNGTTSNYTYDPLYQLTQVTQGGGTTESYGYDAVGNRLSSLSVASYQYNAANELTSSSLGAYTYDNNGNTLVDASARSYTWDFENRLTQAVVPGTNGGTTTFRYDPFGRRIQKSGPLGTTNYVYDVLNVIEEVDNGGSRFAEYTHGTAIDETLSILRGGATSYDLSDGLGSVTSLSTAPGALANTYTYDSFGRLTASSGTATNPIQYTGREFDKETGLYFNRARYYDPTGGRFISEDPIGLEGGINFYGYAFDSPTNLRDPSGRSAGALALPIAEGAGGVICFGSGVCETVIAVGGVVVGTAATGYLIYNWYESRSRGHSDPIPYPGTRNPGQCDKQPGKCNPCPPDSPYWDQPGNEHGATTGVHYHWYHWNQKPYPDCTCYPSRMSGGSPPTGGTPLSPGGDPWP